MSKTVLTLGFSGSSLFGIFSGPEKGRLVCADTIVQVLDKSVLRATMKV